MATRLLLTSNKGGVGKTTETVLLAEALAVLGYRVDVIDLAPQGNATRRLGIDQNRLAVQMHPTIADLLLPDATRRAAYADALVPCGWDTPWAGNIRVVAQVDAAQLQERNEEAARAGSGTRLRRGIGHGDDDAHITLIDSDPGLDHLITNGMAAADGVLLVTEPDFDAVLGAVNVLNHVLSIRDAIEKPDLTVTGVVVTRVRRSGDQSVTQRAAIANLPTAFVRLERGPQAIWADTPVPFFDTLARAQNDGIPLAELSHPAARDLEAVARNHALRVLATAGYDTSAIPDTRKVPA